MRPDAVWHGDGAAVLAAVTLGLPSPSKERVWIKLSGGHRCFLAVID
jgi:hypothetical protein